MYVIKRNNEKELFNKEKLTNSILNTYKSVYIDLDNKQLDNICNIVKSIEENIKDSISTKQIKEQLLSLIDDNDVKECYLNYEKTVIDPVIKKSKLMKEIKEKIEASNVENQNANFDEKSFGGRKGCVNSTVLKYYALNYLLSKQTKENHLNNEIYIHDLDNYAIGCHNCLTIPFDELLEKGYYVKEQDIRPAQSINTAFQIIVELFQVQSLQQFGGVSATCIDWFMIPYVRKSFYKHYIVGSKHIERIDVSNIDNKMSIEDDIYKSNEKIYKYAYDMTINELKQSIESFYHNLNTLASRSGEQLPFTSVNYGTCTEPEGRLVSEYLIKGAIDGIGKYHRTCIFPCLIFQYMKGVNSDEGDKNYDLFLKSLECTALRMYPNYVNCDWSGNNGYDKNDYRTYNSTMGCRTMNGFDINGFGQKKTGRGNIAPTTIILPTLAMQIKQQGKNFKDFINLLGEKIDQAKNSLIERFNYIARQSPNSSQFMYENNIMAGYIPEEGIVSALKHGTLAIGQLGLSDALEILFGFDQTTKEGMKYAIKIEELFSNKCKEFKNKYHLNFGVYYTPAENLCHTALLKFREKYGIIPRVSDKEYFTNSTHVPVYHKISPFDKIDIEAQLTKYSSAGCITYVEMDSGMKHNIKGLETIVKYAMNKDIPYLGINIPLDTCNDCGFTSEMDKCIICDSNNVSHLRRITGYLNGNYKTSFNKGKQDEVKDRFRHTSLQLQLPKSKLDFMPNDFLNGEDVSVSIFVRGCDIRCQGCQNKHLWNFSNIEVLSDEDKNYLFNFITKNNITRNLSILGGEPMDKRNINLVNDLITDYKFNFPKNKVYLWSGYTFEQLNNRDDITNNILSKIDYLIDGPFIESQKDISLKLRGSNNQRIIELNK